jgi:hypothetical protein
MSSIDIYFAIAFLCGLVVTAGKPIAIYFWATDLHRVSACCQYIGAELTLHRPCSKFRASRQIILGHMQ